MLNNLALFKNWTYHLCLVSLGSLTLQLFPFNKAVQLDNEESDPFIWLRHVNSHVWGLRELEGKCNHKAHGFCATPKTQPAHFYWCLSPVILCYTTLGRFKEMKYYGNREVPPN
ncbi:hypothetical protein QQP08_004943 [Theobroma cacao]|nr:hypothetical protein QQP08_004943 [Theobroma cacao]